MQHITNATMTVGLIFFEGASLFDIAGPATYFEVFPHVAATSVDFFGISTQVGPLQGNDYFPLYATTTYEDAPEHLDVLIIPGGLGTDQMVQDEALISFLRDLADEATDVLMVGSGSRLGAATGLLDGKSATTDNEEYDDISSANPSVNWVRQARWVEDGKWWTSSGVTAGLDMVNAFVGSRFDESLAARIARACEFIPIMDSSDDMFA